MDQASVISTVAYIFAIGGFITLLALLAWLHRLNKKILSNDPDSDEKMRKFTLATRGISGRITYLSIYRAILQDDTDYTDTAIKLTTKDAEDGQVLQTRYSLLLRALLSARDENWERAEAHLHQLELFAVSDSSKELISGALANVNDQNYSELSRGALYKSVENEVLNEMKDSNRLTPIIILVLLLGIVLFVGYVVLHNMLTQ